MVIDYSLSGMQGLHISSTPWWWSKSPPPWMNFCIVQCVCYSDLWAARPRVVLPCALCHSSSPCLSFWLSWIRYLLWSRGKQHRKHPCLLTWSLGTMICNFVLDQASKYAQILTGIEGIVCCQILSNRRCKKCGGILLRLIGWFLDPHK